jgi:hypothetical protein
MYLRWRNWYWKSKTVRYDMHSSEVTAEKEVRPRWPRPVRPLRGPREPIEINLMRAIIKQKWSVVWRSGTASQSPEPPAMQSL